MKIRRSISLTLTAVLLISTIFTFSYFATATSESVFRDSLNDLSKISDFGLPSIRYYQCDSGTKVGGDQAIMINSSYFDAIKNSSGIMTLLPSLTWKINGGAKAEFFGYLWDTGKNFTLSWSADGQSFTDIPLTAMQIDEITSANKADKNLADEYTDSAPGDISHRLYTIAAIDSTAKYFKVTWPVIDGSWKAAPSMVRFTGGTPVVEDLTCDVNITMTNNKETDTEKMVSLTNAFQYDQSIAGNKVLMVDYSYVSGKTSVAPPFVVYRAEDEKAFIAKFLAFEQSFKLNFKPTFYVSDSPSGTFTEIAVQRTRIAVTSDTGISNLTYTIPKLPAGKNYVKIVFPQERDYTGVAWPDGTPGASDGVMNYVFTLYSVQYTQVVETPVTVETDTTVAITGSSLEDSKAFADYSKNMFDFTQALGGGALPFLSLSYSAVIGKTTLPEAYVVYKVKEGSPFVLEGVNHVGHVNMGHKFKLMSSSDKTNWTELTNYGYTIHKSTIQDGFYDETFTVTAIPANHKYVKIVWPNKKDYTGTVDPVSGETYNDPMHYAPGLAKVKYNKAAEETAENSITEVVFNGNEAQDSGDWSDYTKNVFDFTQKLSGTPFLSLKYETVLGKQILPEIYVMYKVKDGSPFILKSINHKFMLHMSLKFKLFSSADKASWEELTNYAYESSSGEGSFYNEAFTIENLPAGHQYVKVVWPNQKDYTGTEDPVDHDTVGDPLHYSPGLLSASFILPTNTGIDETDPANITGDTTVTFTGNESTDSKKMYSYNKNAIDFTQMLQFGESNYSVLMLNYDFVDKKSSLPEAYVTYKVAENSPFKVEGFTNTGAAGLGLKFKLYASFNGKDWALIENVLYKTLSVEGTSWQKEIYGVRKLPDGMKYVKVVWPNEKDYTGVTNPADGQTLDTLNYAPALASVTFNGYGKNANTGDMIFWSVILLLLSAAAALILKVKRIKN